MSNRLNIENTWFRENILCHEDLLRAWIHDRYPSIENLDDIIQAAYMEVMKRQRKMPIEYPKSFLFAVCRNIAVDSIRKSKVISFQDLAMIHQDDLPRTDVNTVRDAVRASDEASIIYEAIDTLPAKCRQILILRKLKGLSLQEISEVLGISIKTVEAHITKGIKLCRLYFKNFEGELGR